MFGNYNAYQPVGTPQQFAMDQMQQFQQRAQMQQGIQLIRVTGMDGGQGISNASQLRRAPVRRR